MTAYTIQLTNEQVETFVKRAEETGLPPTQLLQEEVEALFDRKRIRRRSLSRMSCGITELITSVLHN